MNKITFSVSVFGHPYRKHIDSSDKPTSFQHILKTTFVSANTVIQTVYYKHT